MYEFMKKYFIEDIVKKIGEEVELYGWVNNVRDHKKIIFVDLRDRSGIVQIVGDETFRELSPEDVVYIKGTVQKRPENLVNKKVKTGTIEIKATKYKLISKAATPPFDTAKEELDLQLPTLLDYRSLTLRHPKIAEIFKIQEKVVEAFRKISKELGCIEIFVPTIAASATEGGAEVFKLDYYEHQATLAQSPQLYKQMMVPVFERVFTIAHAYRAEPSVTTRHLSEVVQLDCEFGFVSFGDLLDLLEKVGIETVKSAVKIKNGKIPRLTLKEAQEIIFKEAGRDVRGEDDLSNEDEGDLCKWAEKKHNSDFVTITHFPTAKRAFYTMPDPQDSKYSLSYDLLYKGMELASGSQRINDFKELVSAIKKRQMDPKDFEMYLMAFQYGMPPEGGFSFGLERLTKTVLDLPNIREASLFPRDMERVDIKLNDIKK